MSNCPGPDELAVASGIDSSKLRGYESRRSLMGFASLVRIAEALQHQIAFICPEYGVHMVIDPFVKSR